MRCRSTFLFVSLLAPFVFSCSGEGPTSPTETSTQPQVRSFSPQGLTTTRTLVLTLDRPMVKPAQLGTKYEGPDLFLITPPLPGHYEWQQVNVLAFIPSEPFRKSTRYTVNIRADALPKALDRDQTYTFRTKLFTLESVEPFYERAAQLRVNLVFTHAVDPGTVKLATRFSMPDGRAVNAELETKTKGKVMAFRLDVPRAEGDDPHLDVEVDGGLSPLGINSPIGKTVVRKVALKPSKTLKLQNMYPQQSGDAFGVRVRFSANVNPAEAQSLIVVEPPLKFSAERSYRGVTLTGPFEPSTSYKVIIKKGLLGQDGSETKEQVERTVTMPHISPSVAFDDVGSYLMRQGNQSIAVKSVNVAAVHVTVSKVPENNIAHVVPRIRARAISCRSGGCWDADEYEYRDESRYFDGHNLGTFGVELFTGTVKIEGDKNQRVVTNIPYSELNDDPRRGVYRVRIADAKRRWIYAEKWLLATDLGITVKSSKTEARARVISLSTLEPVVGARVTFLSRTNQVIGKVNTDKYGLATQSLLRMRPGEPLSLVTAQAGADFSYLALAGTQILTADFDVGGAGDSASAYEAYVYPDRGIYRPGDTAHLTVMIRDRALKTPPAFPTTVEIRDPKWRPFRRIRSTSSQDGVTSHSLKIPQDALTGTYTLRVMSSASSTPIGRLSFKVEDFMPDRISVDVTPQADTVSLGDAANFDIASAYLFGAPASGLRVESTCRFVETAITSKQYRSFPIASYDRGEAARRVNVTNDLGHDVLSDAGKSVASCILSEDSKPLRPVRTTLVATVSETGGRAVTAQGWSTVHAHEHYVGVRRDSEEQHINSGQDAGLKVLVVDRKGQTKPNVKVKAIFSRINWRSILKNVNGRYRYVSEETREQLAEQTVTSGSRQVDLPFKPGRPGRYHVKVVTDPGGASSNMSFWVSGSGRSDWEMTNPDQIGLTLDKKEYTAGTYAKVMVRAPFSGKLFLSVERDRVLWSKTLDLTGNTGTFSVPVSATMVPNAYVVAHVVKSRKSREKHAPMRAFGVVPLMVKATQHQMGLKVIAPSKIRPNSTLEVKLKLDTTTRGRVTVAAVDEGILRVTGFASPDPLKYFARKRRLGVHTHDMYDLLLPEVSGRGASVVRDSGHGDSGRKKHLNPISVKRVKPVALWSGVLETSEDGWAVARLDVPQFNGALRLMVVGFKGSRFAAKSKSITVRDPIVLTPTFPRFSGPLDEFDVPVEVFNGTGRDGDFTVALSFEGKMAVAGEARKAVRVPAGQQKLVRFTARADEVVGKVKAVVEASGNGEKTRSETELAIRPTNTTTTESTAAVVTAAKPARYRIPHGWMKGTLGARVLVGTSMVAKFGPSLQYVLTYPHGCVEQTTSRAFPLLYVGELARSTPDLLAGANVDAMVAAGIDRLLSMQTRTGALAYWPGGDYGYPWSTAYGAHFLVEASNAGFPVSRAALGLTLAHLTSLARGAWLPTYRGRQPGLRARAYALYVLALAKRPLNSTVHHLLARQKAAKSKDPETYALLEGALLVGGDRSRRGAFSRPPAPTTGSSGHGGFGSRGRIDALTLSVLADAYPTHKSVPALMKSLANSAKNGRWRNTQENAYALLALGKITKRLGSGEYWGTIQINGKELKKFSHKKAASVSLKGDDLAGQDISISVTGAGSAFVSFQAEGIKTAALPASSQGLTLTREYFDRNGAKVDPAAIIQGDMVVTKVTVEPEATGRLENIAVVELLPAGLEVENPRLSGDAVMPWMAADRSLPDYMDIRDDRVVFFTSLDNGSKRSFYYSARAVTRGDFVLPHVTAEAMYDPSVRALAGAGRVKVNARGN